MKYQNAQTKNLASFLELFKTLGSLNTLNGEVHRIGLAHGRPGLGKTTAMIAAANGHNAIYLCANPTWTSRTLLEKLTTALGGSVTHRLSDMHDQVAGRLTFTGRSILLDEADSIFDSPKLVETFRSLHDASTHGVFVLVGMEKARAKLAKYPQLERRVQKIVEFLPLSLEDVQLVLAARCEVPIAKCLTTALHKATGGQIAGVCAMIPQIEELGAGKTEVTLEDWGRRPFTL